MFNTGVCPTISWGDVSGASPLLMADTWVRPRLSLAARGKSPDRPCARDLASAGKARGGGDARASSTTSNAVRRRQTPGALRVAGGADPSALLRLLDDAWASPASPRLLSGPAAPANGLSDFCHGLLESLLFRSELRPSRPVGSVEPRGPPVATILGSETHPLGDEVLQASANFFSNCDRRHFSPGQMSIGYPYTTTKTQ